MKGSREKREWRGERDEKRTAKTNTGEKIQTRGTEVGGVHESVGAWLQCSLELEEVCVDCVRVAMRKAVK